MCEGHFLSYNSCSHTIRHITTRCTKGDCCDYLDFPSCLPLPDSCPSCTPPNPNSHLLASQSHEIIALKQQMRHLEATLLSKMEENLSLKSTIPAKLQLKGIEETVADGLLAPMEKGKERMVEEVKRVNNGCRGLIFEAGGGNEGVRAGMSEREVKEWKEKRIGGYEVWDRAVWKAISQVHAGAIMETRKGIVELLRSIS